LFFLGHNLLTTNTRKPINGSKYADFRLDFLQKRKKKLPLAVEAKDQVMLAKKGKTYT